MNGEAGIVNNSETLQARRRPVLLSVLCIFSFVYLGLLSLLFFTCIFYSGTITRVRNLYIPDHIYSHNQLLILFCAFFLLYMVAFAGSLLIWFARKAGYYLLAPACFILATFQAFQPQIATGTTGVNIALILLLGLFFRRLH